MAEASNGISGETAQTQIVQKESPTAAAAGPPSSAELSLAPTDEMSIHLSPRGSKEASLLSPRATKPSGKILPQNKLKTQTTSNIPKNRPMPAAKAYGQVKPKQGVKRGDDTGLPKEKCDMCDDNKVMAARCLNCESSMCSSCVTHHRKIAPDHELQQWGEYTERIKTPAIPQVPSGKQQCKVHPGEKLLFYCKVCNKPLCINCKLTKHEGHRTRDLWEEIKDQREILPAKLGQIKASFLPVMKQQLQELDDYDKHVAYNVKGTIENIEKRSKVMKDEIDRTSGKLIERLRHKEKQEMERVEQRKKMLSGYLRSATTAIASGDRVVKSGDDFEVMEMFQNILDMIKKMQELMKRKPGKVKYVFQDGQLTQSQLQTMFGGYMETGSAANMASPRRPKTKMLPSLQMVPEIQIRLLKTFQCKMVPGNKVSAIAPINETEAWISFGWTTNEIYLYNKDGFRKNKVLFRAPVDDIAIHSDGNVVVSTFTGNIVRYVDRKLQVRDFFQCPLRCRGLTVTTGGEIIVCGVDTCTAIPPPTKSTVFKFTAKGNKTGHLDGEKGKKIPIHPYRVTENIDGSLAVTDWINDKEGRVVIFSHDGKIRMVYYGNNNENRTFLPYGITSDKFGHVIVSDIVNQEVHLLDIKGHFLRILLTKSDLDGERPYSLAVDPMGMLWVGNERAQIKIYRYLVQQSHIV